MTKYKLVIPIKGIMILVFWEKSFKGMEADYSNHLSSSLLASFVGKDYTNFRRARARTLRISHGCYTLVLLVRVSLPPFITTRDTTGGQLVMLQLQHS